MKIFFMTIFACLFLINSDVMAFGASLDEMYRDIVKNENEGRLPLYVRKGVEIKPHEYKSREDVIKRRQDEERMLSIYNQRKVKLRYKLRKQAEWKQIIKNVMNNRVSPFEMREIERRVNNKDKEAIEIYAWMKANGVGCGKDLMRSWKLYKQGAMLGIKRADENAKAVYKSMSTYQRQLLR